MKKSPSYFPIFLLILLSNVVACGKKHAAENDLELTKQDIKKNIAIIHQIDSWSEKDDERILDETKSEDFNKIINARSSRILSNKEVEIAINKLSQYSANKDNRELIANSLRDKTHGSFTRLAILESLKKTALWDNTFRDFFIQMMEDESEDPFIRHRIIALISENNIKMAIPKLIKLFSTQNRLLGHRISSTIASFGPLSLTPILHEINYLFAQSSPRQDQLANDLAKLTFIAYKKNSLDEIEKDVGWSMAINSKYENFMSQEVFCKFQKLALDITVHFAFLNAIPNINIAIQENYCPENLSRLKDASKILDLL